MQRAPVVEQMPALPGVDDNRAVGVVDQPGLSRHPIAPVRIGENRKLAQNSTAVADHLRGLDLDPTGLDGVDFHGGESLREVD
jgi:hypothetical protein